MSSELINGNFIFSFDVGHASIGWSVVKSDGNPQNDPDIVDCGVVLFQKDSCLASKRRQYRRTRRNIRAARQRITRIKKLLAAKNILPESEMDNKGHMAPFFLAARALSGKHTLSPLELWHILRWYAHNRGYDGNARWQEEENAEDTEKLSNAIKLMEVNGTRSMAETICSMLGLDPRSDRACFHKETPAYRIANAAFPRQTVYREVETILKRHESLIAGLDRETIDLILTQEPLSGKQRQTLNECGITRLPKRYCGGLLFGQLVPRFDNRIISKCPVSWALHYDHACHEGLADKNARQIADKFSKTPLKSCSSFLRYRLARLIANIRAGGAPLPEDVRKEIFQTAESRGSVTPKDIQSIVKQHLGDVDNNISNYLELHPDSREALILDPALDYARKALEITQNPLKPFYHLFPEELKRMCISRWKKGKSITLKECLKQITLHGGNTASLEHAIEREIDGTGKKKKRDYATKENLLNRPFKPKPLQGRAPYSKTIMEQVVREILEGTDSTRPARSEHHPDGEDKNVDGVLYPLLDPNSRINRLAQKRSMDELTNNHLVRHRMLILSRLVNEMIAEYAQGDPSRVARVIVEVGREISQFSGMTAKEIQAELNYRLRDFKSAVTYLEKYAPELNITGGLIRKCRIAMDMGWTCPFTSQKYTPQDLHRMEREHIVPYSNIKTNALHALVLTFPEINRMKGKRTAMQFIRECANMPVKGIPNLSILTPAVYKKLVDGLNTKGHKSDAERKKARKALMLVEEITPENEKEQDFTMGQMSRSSHLMKLASRILKAALPETVVNHIPGAVNALLRTSWNTMGCLAEISPDILNEDGSRKPKDDIRGITHMHHALDAVNLALAWHYIPNMQNGRTWTWLALLKRKKDETDRSNLKQYKLLKTNEAGGFIMMDIPARVKKNLSKCLARERVMQHIPADRSGAITGETTWRILGIEGEGDGAVALVTQRTSTVKDGKRIRTQKPVEEVKVRKLLGAIPKGNNSKLRRIKGGIKIDGNFGIALDPEPKMIVHHNVQQQIDEIARANKGKTPRIIRPYSLIKLEGQGERDGIWIVRSLKDNKIGGLSMDLTRPSFVKVVNKNPRAWINVSVRSLIKKGFEIMQDSYLGHPRM